MQIAKANEYKKLSENAIKLYINDLLMLNEEKTTDLVVDVSFKSFADILAQIGGIFKIVTVIFISMFSPFIYNRFIHTLARVLRRKLNEQSFTFPSRKLS